MICYSTRPHFFESTGGRVVLVAEASGGPLVVSLGTSGGKAIRHSRV